MATLIGDMHKLERANGTDPNPPAPYASRGAGLYSEVSWDPIASLRARAARSADKDGGPHPSPPA